METLNYTMNRKRKGTRTFYFATLNNKRFSKTNFARKYDAKGEVKFYIKKLGINKLIEMAS